MLLLFLNFKTYDPNSNHYYDEVFEENKKSIKATWKYKSEIICKSSNQRKMLSKININSNIVTDLEEICDRYNEFFAGIGPKLANNINTENKKKRSAHILDI